ncbi:MAG TPA: hypothetical protein VMT11_05505 [Myxococcaceae bacterium]|nr:hypothetical protein [Myxococcaceae bacterium]
MNEPCQRFEDEALERLESGLPLDEHFGHCPDCVRRMAQHRQVAEGLRSLHATAPGAGWEERVLARISETARRKASRRRTVLASVTAMLAAAAAGYVFFLRGPPPAAHPTLAAIVRPGRAGQLRGLGVQPGDVIELTANRGGASSAEIRLYRNDADLVFRCPDPARPLELGRTCFVRTQLLVGTVPVPGVGVYQPLLVTSTRPVPEPTGSLQTDSARLLESGAAVLLGPSIRAY